MRSTVFFIAGICLGFLNVNSQTLLKVQVKANQLIYDSYHNLIYATVSSKDSIYGNKVVAINPSNGQVVNSVFAGSEPNAITLTSDGNYIFVGLDGATIVKKINLNTFAVVDIINLGSDSFFGGYFPYDLATINNNNNIVIVSRKWQGTSPPQAGIVVYKGQTKLPQGTTYTNYGFDIEYDYKKGKLYAYDSQTTGSQLATFNIDTTNGITQINSVSLNIGQNMKYANHGIFGNGKILVDVSGSTPYQAATFSYNPSAWGYATTANDSATTYYISETINNTGLHVVSFNANTYVQSGQVTYTNVVPNSNYEAIRMTSINTNNYAVIVKDTYSASFYNIFGWFVLLTPYNILGIDEKKLEYAGGQIYPNPASGVINLKYKCTDCKDMAIVISNGLGQTVMNVPYQNNIDVSQLQPGLYTIAVSGERNLWYSKFVKE